VARYAAGTTPDITVIIGGQKFVLQLIPCGVAEAHLQGHHRNGVVLDPIAFLKEVAKLRSLAVDVDKPAFCLEPAQVILPYHRMIEAGSGKRAGTQEDWHHSRGIGRL